MQDVIVFPRTDESLLWYNVNTGKKIAGWEPGGLTRDTFDRIKDFGTSQLLYAISRMTPEHFTVDAQQVNPPDMVFRANGVEQTAGRIVITPPEGTTFNLDAVEILARFSTEETVTDLDAVRNDTGEQVTFADVYVGLKLVDSEGHMSVVYVVNAPLSGREQIDGKHSGVIVEETKDDETKRTFYSYSDGQINTPRIVGLFSIKFK